MTGVPQDLPDFKDHGNLARFSKALASDTIRAPRPVTVDPNATSAAQTSPPGTSLSDPSELAIVGATRRVTVRVVRNPDGFSALGAFSMICLKTDAVTYRVSLR